jgi:diguanylate cyclase (GGDEF)-like protein
MKPDPALDGGVSPLEALLELSRSASEDPLPRVLSTVAETVHRSAGFASVVLNIFRPAWDDYEALLVIGQEGVEALAGTTIARATLAPLLTMPQQLPGVFFLPGESGLWEGIENSFIPDLPPTDDPDAWRAEDGLLVFLSDSDGQPLALVSVDEPVSGRRPGEDDLRLLRAICSHTEHGLESARRAERTAENQRMLSLLLEVSPALTACSSTAELLNLAGETVVPALGFERFAAYTVAAGEVELCSTCGCERDDSLALALDLDQITSLLAPEREHAGCFLLQAQELFAVPRDPNAERSARNGRGPAAWNDHCLVAPLRRETESMLGLIVIEDPVDRLLPSDERRRIVRLLLDQIGAAWLSIEHRARLSHLASHDPLTGVRNRRGLDDVLSSHQDVALLVCDIDHFKQVNDRYGHNLGDRVLARFGELLREFARESDVAMRLGGEEFCVVMPNTDDDGAVHAAERLRSAVSSSLQSLVPDGLTVSIGVATTTRGVLDARALMAAADQGLYIAKDTGRDRTVCVTDA